MTQGHSFQYLFETFGKNSGVHAESVNREARERLKKHLEGAVGGAGMCVLLKAPRAGYGKTHLLTRLQYELGGTHEFVPLHAVGGSRIDAETVMDDVLRRMVRALPAAGGLTVFDLVARRLFAAALQPLVRAGEVPCQDREGAMNALSVRPIETFDFHHPGAVTAHWARENFELLGPRLSMELSNKTGNALKEVAFWVEAMFRYAATPLGNAGRVRVLFGTVFDSPGADVVYHERLVSLLSLMSHLMKVVLVADELEGFSTDEAAALRFASFLVSLRQEVESLEVVVSVNEDVWKNAFVPRLSGGLVDRLSELVIELEPLDRARAVALLETRMPGYGELILREMEDGSVPVYSRGLVLEAGKLVERKKSPGVDVPAVGVFEMSPEVDPFEAATSGVFFEKAPEVEVRAPEQAVGQAPSFGWPSPDVGEVFSGGHEPVRGFSGEEGLFGQSGEADAEKDRVDELLRQFRERYGKG